MFKNLLQCFEILKIRFHKAVDCHGCSEQSVSYIAEALSLNRSLQYMYTGIDISF